MECQEEEEPDRVRKRKREKGKRSKNIPPERKDSTKKKSRSKYLLVGVPKTRACSDHPSMAALDFRIKRAALILEKKYGSVNTIL